MDRCTKCGRNLIGRRTGKNFMTFSIKGLPDEITPEMLADIKEIYPEVDVETEKHAICLVCLISTWSPVKWPVHKGEA
jgi:hypothetical protein